MHYNPIGVPCTGCLARFRYRWIGRAFSREIHNHSCYEVCSIGMDTAYGTGHLCFVCDCQDFNVWCASDTLATNNINMTKNILMNSHVFIVVDDCGSMRTEILHRNLRFSSFPMQLISHPCYQRMTQAICIRQYNGTIRFCPSQPPR